MPTLVALLRGINVGTAKRVAMADLRKLVETLGYGEVRTLLNSGNIVFTAADRPAKAAARIERALRERLGVSARVMAVTAEELAAIIEENPLAASADNPSHLLVAFLADPADRSRLRPLLKQKWGTEVLALGSHAAYCWLPDGISTSPLFPVMARALDNAVTTRNWSTVLKLQAMAESET